MTPALRNAACAQFEHVLEALPDGVAFDEWQSNGARIETLTTHDAVFAWGYLHGLADHAEIALDELLSICGVVN